MAVRVVCLKFFVPDSHPAITAGYDKFKKLDRRNQLVKFIANSYWSESNRNRYATWPRLSTTSVANNKELSTWFMRDGSFLRLKLVELGYTVPQKIVSKWGMSNLRLYMSSTNLFVLSKFKDWDVELAGNGLNYPLQRVFNIGVNVSF